MNTTVSVVLGNHVCRPFYGLGAALCYEMVENNGVSSTEVTIVCNFHNISKLVSIATFKGFFFFYCGTKII